MAGIATERPAADAGEVLGNDFPYTGRTQSTCPSSFFQDLARVDL